MDEMAEYIAKYVGATPQVARLAVGSVFAFIEARDPDIGAELIAKVPGAREAVIDAAKAPTRGVLGKMLGGVGKLVGGHQADVLALSSKLTGMGLSADQLQKLARSVFTLAAQAVGREKIQTITDTIPGFTNFLWPNG